MHLDTSLTHALFNVYLIIIFFGILVILIKLHDIKLLIKTFFETASLLNAYINKLETELHKDEIIIEHRVDKVSNDIIDILKHMKKYHKEENEEK